MLKTCLLLKKEKKKNTHTHTQLTWYFRLRVCKWCLRITVPYSTTYRSYEITWLFIILLWKNWVTSAVTNHFYSQSTYDHVAHALYMKKRKKKKKINSEIPRENNLFLLLRNKAETVWPSYHNLLTNKTVINSEGEFCKTHLREEEEMSWNWYKK